MKYFLILMVLLFSGYTNAVCVTGTKNLSTITAGDMIVQRDAPIGTIIGSFRTTQIQQIMANCYTSGTRWAYFDYMGAVAVSPGLYQTNLPGVGVYLELADTHARSFLNPVSTATIGLEATTKSVVWVWPGGDSNLVFVKTGDITSGILQPGVVMHHITDDGGTIRQIDFAGGSVTQVACSIRTPNMVFPLGDVPVSTFGNTVGFVPNVSSTQNLGLDCDAGANINVALNATQNPDSADPSVLALNNQGGTDTADGVGVQLLYNDMPLVLNDRIVLNNTAGGVETFPLKARYIQTKTAVTAGDASTSATLQLTYQ